MGWVNNADIPKIVHRTDWIVTYPLMYVDQTFPADMSGRIILLMARSHVRLQFGLWRKPGHTEVSKDARFLYVTILGDEALNQAGVVIMRPPAWAEDAAMTADEAVAALDELEAREFVVIDDHTHELLVRTFIRNDGVVDQPNVLRNALAIALRVRSPKLRRAIAVELRKFPAPPPSRKTPGGRLFVYPDPHAVARELDPDGDHPGSGNPSEKGSIPPSGGVNPSENSSGIPSEKGSNAASSLVDATRNPSGTDDSGTLLGTLGGRYWGRGRGRGKGLGFAGTQVSTRSRPEDDQRPEDDGIPAVDGLFDGTPPEPKQRRSKPKTSTPDKFDLDLSRRSWFRDEGLEKLGVDIKFETAQFLDHHRAKGSQFQEWGAAWKRWMRNAGQYAHERSTRPGGNRPRVSATELPASDWRRWVQE